MSKSTLFIVGALLLAPYLRAQPDDFGAGCLFDEDAFTREVEQAAEFSNDGRRAADLPRWISLRPYCPIPGQQGAINSCVGWAMGYAALTASCAYRDGLTDRKAITERAFSALFIYNQIKINDCLGGAYVHEAGKFLREHGTCPHQAFDEPATDCGREPAPALREQAKASGTIADVVALFDNKADARTRVMRTKRSLSEGKPVVIGLAIYPSLKNLKRSDPVWRPVTASEKKLGGHAVCVVGYNDSLSVFEIMNSWGPYWADAGFFFVSYRDFAGLAFQGVQILLPERATSPPGEAMAALEASRQETAMQAAEKLASRPGSVTAKPADLNRANPKQPKPVDASPARVVSSETTSQPISPEATAPANRAIPGPRIDQDAELEAQYTLFGSFVVRVPVTDEFGSVLNDENGQPKFLTVDAKLEDGVYRLSKTDWLENDMFQVVASQMRKDRYVYVFSYDGNGKAQVHFPRPTGTGRRESALVPHRDAELVLPSQDRVLVRENLLDDHIVVAYATARIADFHDRVDRLTTLPGTFTEKFHTAFADLLIPAGSIEYRTDAIQCAVLHGATGIMAPVIVQLENR